MQVIDGEVWVEAGHRAPDHIEGLFGRQRRAHIGRHVVQERRTDIRWKRLPRDIGAYAPIPEILDHADDLHIRDRARLIAEPDVTPHGIAIAEVMLRQLLIDDDHVGDAERNAAMLDGGGIAVAEITAVKQRDTQSRKIPGTD